MKQSDVSITYQKLKRIRPLLKNWIKLHTTYVKKWDKEDAAYWYTERTNIGILAAAVWKKGGFSLEEFGTDKKHCKKTKDEIKTGRGDLWFGWKNVGYTVEAKQIFVKVNTNNVQTKLQKIEGSLADAKKDAVKVKYKGNHALGITFVVPYINPKYKTEVNKILALLPF